MFYPIKIYDRLQVEEATDSHATECNIVSEGYAIAGDSKDNLVVKAYNLIRQEYKIPAVNVKLSKLIPMGAGLGGGSSDAAYMLKALNDLFKLNIPEEKLQQIAAKLGADCAIFIKNQPVYATGIGNVFHYDVNIPSLTGKTIVVVKPDVFVSTKDAYSMVHPKKPKFPLTESICKPIEMWKNTIVNDFEVSVFAKFPLIGDVKTKLYNLGAEYASMSGSGSSVFGIFNKPIENFEIHFPDMFSVQIPL